MTHLTPLFDLPIDDLESRLGNCLAAAIMSVYGVEVDPRIRRSDHADFQADFALALAKQLGVAPREVAKTVVDTIEEDSSFIAEVSGPGFVNITLTDETILNALDSLLRSRSLGVPYARELGTVVVDYSAPNVAKEMHVGHLRSTVIGDAIVRLLEQVGHRVIRQNHLGDWGTPFGMLIEHLLDLESDGVLVGDEIEDLDGFYRTARKKFDGDSAFADRARSRVVKLQASDELTTEKWKLIVEISARYFQRIYSRLGVKLTLADVAGESQYNSLLGPLCSNLADTGQATISDGALCVFPNGFLGREGNPLPLILRKGDGGFGYATTDLAALRYRISELRAAYNVYVVGAPQKQHLEMVFKVVGEAGWLRNSGAIHVPFGSVLGPDGRVFRTRGGETVKLESLLLEAEERAKTLVAKENPELDVAEVEQIGRSVGMAAVKFADLRNQRTKDYVFDLDGMVAIEGDTGPYLQYTHARARSILRRVQGVVAKPDTRAHLDRYERDLALGCTAFPRAVEGALQDLSPHVLATYLIRIARSFNSLYAVNRVVGEPASPELHTRTFLVFLTAEIMAMGLDLLGIDSLDRV